MLTVDALRLVLGLFREEQTKYLVDSYRITNFVAGFIDFEYKELDDV